MTIREAIVLAAGLSTRLSAYTKGLPKQVIELFGVPLIAYPMASLMNAGVEKFHIVVNPKSYQYLSDFFSSIDVNVNLIVNREPERGNGYSFTLALDHLDGKYAFLSMSDHIFHPAIPKVLLGCKQEYDILVGADSAPVFIDIDEATKVQVAHGGTVINIGKQIPVYTHIDIGLFIVNRGVADLCKKYADSNYTVKLANLIKHAVETGRKVVIADVKGLPWLDVDTIHDVHKALTQAENFLREMLNLLSEHFSAFARIKEYYTAIVPSQQLIQLSGEEIVEESNTSLH